VHGIQRHPSDTVKIRKTDLVRNGFFGTLPYVGHPEKLRPATSLAVSGGSVATAGDMYPTTFIMIAATFAALLTWVFCEYTVEAVRVLRVLAQEDEQRTQRNQQTGHQQTGHQQTVDG
jgi:hypothetical protein